MEKFTSVAQLGRFVLRDKGLTVALGKIYDVCEDLSLKADIQLDKLKVVK